MRGRAVAGLASGGVIMLRTWVESTPGHLKFSKSTDQGATWSSPVTVHTNAGSIPRDPAVYAVSATTFLVSFYISGASTVYVYRSTNSGASWTQVKTFAVSNGQETNMHGYRNVVYLVWSQDDDKEWSKSTDGGATWAALSQLGNGGAREMDIFVIDETHAFVSAPDYTVGSSTERMFVSYTTDGSSWTDVQVASSASIGSAAGNGVWAISDSIIILAYFDDNQDVHFWKSTDAGLTWPTHVMVDTTPASGTGCRLVAVDSQTFYVFYCADSGIKMAKTTNGGTSWVVSALPSPGQAVAETLSAVALYKERLRLHYVDNNTSEEKLATSNDGGASWAYTVLSTGAHSDGGSMYAIGGLGKKKRA